MTAVQANPAGQLSARISLGDEAALTWFLGRGQSTFHRSTFGAILERISSDAYVSTECTMCNGEGILEDGGFWMQKLEGGGYAEKTAEHGGWCDRCRGVGSMPIRKKHSRNPLTARPKKDSGEGSGYTPDDSALTRYAIVSRRLDLVAAAHGKAMVEVLVAYYGDVGSRWGRTPHGRLFAVYALTGAGHKLVRMSMARTSEGITLSAAERIGVEAETEKTQPKPNRRALLDAAAGQALTLYERASAAWNATKSRATHLTSVTNEVGEMVPFVDVKFGPLPVMGTGER